MKKFSIAKAIAVLILLFSASVTRAQTRQMEPIPATDLGQTIEITSTDPLWAPFWDAANQSRAAGQVILDNGGDPTDQKTCISGVCCQTVHYYNYECGSWRFVTSCWEESSGRAITKVLM